MKGADKPDVREQDIQFIIMLVKLHVKVREIDEFVKNRMLCIEISI